MRKFDTSTYIVLIIYIIFGCFAVYSILVIDPSFSLPSFKDAAFHPLNTTKTHLQTKMKPVIQQISRRITKRTMFISSVSIILLTFIFGFVWRRVLQWILDRYSETMGSKSIKQISQRILRRKAPLQFEMYNPSTKHWQFPPTSTNYISTTIFDTNSSLKLALLSFVYGTAQYLVAPMQLWCLAIALVQLFVFATGKSFVPLAVFTIFIAIMFARSQLKQLQVDTIRNEKKVNIVDPVTNNVVVKNRGALVPGDIVRLRPDEEAPADLIIIRAGVVSSSTSSQQRILFFMNERSVSGENAPLKKNVIKMQPQELQRIEVTDIQNRKVELIKEDGSSVSIDDSNIAFANSIVVANATDFYLDGIVTWISTETKALSASTSHIVKQASPIEEYSQKGFYVAVVILLLLATLDAITAYYFAELDSKKKSKFGAMLINHIMYLNMLVPQAMEQVRLLVSAFLSFEFRSCKDVHCNNSKVMDVLGNVTRIITDKTGSLTKNAMNPKIHVLFPSALQHQNGQFSHPLQPIVIHLGQPKKGECATDTHPHLCELNALAIFGTTGMEPEEVALRNAISSYTEMIQFEPPESNESISGKISFKNKLTNDTVEMTVHIAFGFWRSLLAKASVIELDGKYFVVVQSGGDDFWIKHQNPVKASNIAKLAEYEKLEKSFTHFRGAPRAWSNGVKQISKEFAEELIQEWHQSFVIEKMKRETVQLEIVKKALAECELVSKTLIIDEYREGIEDAIKELHEKGKQISMCTGDSTGAAKTIATQLNFPKNHFVIRGESEETCLQSIEIALQHSMKQESLTLFLDQQAMHCLEQLETKNNGFSGTIFTKLFTLLEWKHSDKQDVYLHFIIFCRATPALKKWCVRLLQHQFASKLLDRFLLKRHYVMAIGDGANDLGMFKQSDVSFGIFSGETKDVVDQADFYDSKWSPVTDLILSDGVEKSVLMSTMLKLVFTKQFMTAFALLADLILSGFVPFPKDPIDPTLMVVYNGIIFMQIISHSSSDALRDSSQLLRKNLMSVKSLVRWLVAAIGSGFVVTWIVRLLFPQASAEQFGASIQIAQAFCMTVYIWSSTNIWKQQTEDEKTDSKKRVATTGDLAAAWIGVFSILFTFAIVLLAGYYIEDPVMELLAQLAIVSVFGYSATKFFSFLNDDMNGIVEDVVTFWKLPTDAKVAKVIQVTHSFHGRLIPILFFLFVGKFVNHVPLLGISISVVLSSLASGLFFLLAISRNSFLRAFFEGRVLAVMLVAFSVGVFVGRNYQPVPAPVSL